MIFIVNVIVFMQYIVALALPSAAKRPTSTSRRASMSSTSSAEATPPPMHLDVQEVSVPDAALELL